MNADLQTINTSEWVNSYLNDVSRTFALSISYLDSPHKEHISISYLLCRISDTIEDDMNIDPEIKNNLLQSYKEIFTGEQTAQDFTNLLHSTVNRNELTNTDWDLVFETETAISIYHTYPAEIQDIIAKWVIELTEGMQKYVSRSVTLGVQIQDKADLYTYCYYVAGTVGHLIVELLAHESELELTPEVTRLAEEYGVFLQYINILKNIYEDYTIENNVYLPQDHLDEYGIPRTQILSHDDTTKIVEELLTDVWVLQDSAQEFLNMFKDVSPNNYQGWAIPAGLANETAIEIEKQLDLATEEPEVKISRDTVQNVIQQTEKVTLSEILSGKNS